MENAVCGRCGKNDSGIVHSGTDGIYLGVLKELHKICYDCGNKNIGAFTVVDDSVRKLSKFSSQEEE